MDPIMDVARRHDLIVVEDAAQADGGSYKGQRLGTFGDVGCFSLQFNKIITSGEGGVVITDDLQIWRRVTMFHDVIGGLRNDIPRDEVLWGINFRMTELQAAVMLVQLRRLDGVLEQMRARKEMLKAGIKDVVARKGMGFRRMTDVEGDTAVALVMFANNSEKAEQIAEALHAENIGASVMYSPDHMDYHIYQHWLPIMEQRTWTEDDGPWAWAQREIEYTPDMCPRTLDLLGRAVHLDVNPLLTNQDVEETVDGINKVLEALA
jgi:dTDP-4-amino-4,6-dideoxygalactose transaminase